MEFAEARLQDAVLIPGEDLVADEFVERHPTPERVFPHEHPRAEDDVGLVARERCDHVGEHLGRVLAVAVDEHDDVKAVLDRVVVAELLVAAVALVHGIREDGERMPVGARLPQPLGERKGSIGRAVVDDQHFRRVAGQRRDALKHAEDRRFGVIGDDEDQDARRAIGNHGRENPSAESTAWRSI